MNYKSGKLDLIIGPMFSHKSSELLDRLVIFAELGLKVLYINHIFDDRNSEHIVSTHNPIMDLKKLDKIQNIDFIHFKSLKGIRKEEYDVIGIDEAQFFDEYLIDFVKISFVIITSHTYQEIIF